MIDIFLPTYKRPGVLQEVARNIEDTTHGKFTLYFGVERDDPESYKAALATGHKAIYNEDTMGYANTIQAIYEVSDAPYFFVGNDDFVFLTDWNKAPVEMLEAKPELMVIGCHDGNPGTNYWTIHITRRSYIKEMSGVVDMPERVFYPYNHNYIDTEFSETAISRGVWEKCEAPCVEHHHPGLAHLFGATKATDPTYEKNNATGGEDANTFFRRRPLWT